MLLTLEVALFASRFVGHLAERQLITAAPALFLALGLWLDRGAPRPQPWTSLAAAVVAVPVVLLPVRVLSNDLTAHNSFTTVPLAKLQEHTSASILRAATRCSRRRWWQSSSSCRGEPRLRCSGSSRWGC